MIRLAEAHDDWIVGFSDEVWWSRFAQPQMHGWQFDEQPLRLLERQKPREDQEAAALACYGLLLEHRQQPSQMLLRFVEGRPVSSVTIEFLDWACHEVTLLGKRVLVLIWDNAGWHISRQVCDWIKQHNQRVKGTHEVRLLVCCLPTKSPWLNPIEPRWLHGKRAIAEADGDLTIPLIIERVCAHYKCESFPLIPQNTS